MTDTDFTLDNGDKVKSLTTGFDGMITARADHLHGCNRYMVQPFMGKDKKLPDSFWFDEDDLEVTKKSVLPRKNNSRGGFPSQHK